MITGIHAGRVPTLSIVDQYHCRSSEHACLAFTGVLMFPRVAESTIASHLPPGFDHIGNLDDSAFLSGPGNINFDLFEPFVDFQKCPEFFPIDRQDTILNLRPAAETDVPDRDNVKVESHDGHSFSFTLVMLRDLNCSLLFLQKTG
jgi:hypothetical protein